MTELLDTQNRKQLIGTLTRSGFAPEKVTLTAIDVDEARYPISPLETANGIVPVDLFFEWGNVFRYGAVADAVLNVGGTDNTVAFQDAIDSGHAAYVPEGYYAINGTIFIISEGSVQGGKTVIMTSNTRLERFGASVEPLIHEVGEQNNVDGNGAVLSVRNAGGYLKGVYLWGTDPAETDSASVTSRVSQYSGPVNFKIIGRSANTGWDKSVGLFVESSAKFRGGFTLPTNFNQYYSSIANIHVQQFDFPFHLSTNVNAISAVGCSAKAFGHAAVSCNGYANQFLGFKAESPSSQDATERFVFYWGKKNDPFGPETGSDKDAASVVITGITNANPAVVTAVAHGEITEAKIKIESVVDAGAGTLEAAVNEGHFQITKIDNDRFSIPIDTSALAAYSSAGIVRTDFYPILGARGNKVIGFTEVAFNAATANVRLHGFGTPLVSYDVANSDGNWARNRLDISGYSTTGGIGTGGASDDAAIGRNDIITDDLSIERSGKKDIHGIKFSNLDDGSGHSIGPDEYKTFSGRVPDMVESYTYDLIEIDNVGATSASILIELVIDVKDATGQDHMAGPITFMCPVTASTARSALEGMRSFIYFGNDNEPALVPIVVEASGTATNTGKFTLKLATQVVTGIGDFFGTWHARITSSNLEGNGLDWDNDVKLLTSSTSGLVVDSKWARKTKFTILDKTRNSTTTLADDFYMNTWDLEPDTEYIILGKIGEDSGSAPDFKCNFDFSQATQSVRILSSWTTSVTLQTTDAGTMFVGQSGGVTVDINGTFKTNATTGGDVSFRWAQNTSDAGATIVRKGSWIKIIRADAMRSELI